MESYDPLTNDMLVREAYERIYGISDNNRGLLSLATHNNSTDPYVESRMEEMISIIIEKKMVEVTGLSIVEILDLPTYVVLMLGRCTQLNAIREAEKIKDLTK